jgi:large subunit ribosomal protein L30e
LIDVNKAIVNAVKTGKVLIGAKKAVESAKYGRAKLILVAANCARNSIEEITYYSKLSAVPLFIYKGNSIDLGAACGKPHIVSALTVREPGDSDILRLCEKEKTELIKPIKILE